MKAVILAGGLGSRLSEETRQIPKPMVTVGDMPILWHIMKMYSHHGINHFVICLGYKGYVIKEYFANYYLHRGDVTIDLSNDSMEMHRNTSEPWKITLVDTGQESMTGGRLKRIADYVKGETFCMTYGDGVSDIDIGALVRFHRKHGKLATVSAIQPPGRWGVLNLQGDRVDSFSEKVDTANSVINGGFFVLEPEALNYIEGDSTIWEKEPMETIARDGQLMAYQHNSFWQAMDTLRDRNALEDLWASGNAPWKKWQEGSSGNVLPLRDEQTAAALAMA